MVPIRIRRLDVVSRVTVHLFVMQVMLAAVFAYLSLDGFQESFAVMLTAFAGIQALFAFTAAPTPSRQALTEWDGVSWLACLALAFYLF